MTPPPLAEPDRAPDAPPAAPDAALPLTGERTVPGVAEETYWFARHVVAYRLAAELARERGAAHVIDAGCGEGYGLALLAEAVRAAPPGGRDARVTGIELDPTVVAHARQRYGTDPVIAILEAELGAVPLAPGSADLIVLLQVIEHLHDVDHALVELARLAGPDGAVLVSTPNRRTFSPGDAAPVNPFHVREFAADELTDVLANAALVPMRQLGLHHGPRLAGLERAHGTTLHDALTAGAPSAWPDWLAAVVPSVTPEDFVLVEGEPGTSALEDALDLLVIATPGPS